MSILDAPIPVQEICVSLLNTCADIMGDMCCAPHRIQLVCPAQLILWTFTGGAGNCKTDCSAVAAITKLSMLMMCQRAFPRRINLSAQQYYLDFLQSSLILVMTGSMVQ